MTSKKALDNLKEINRKQNNGNGDIWLETMIIEPIEKDLEVLEILKKHIYIDDYNVINISFDCSTQAEKEEYVIKEWLDNEKV